VCSDGFANPPLHALPARLHLRPLSDVTVPPPWHGSMVCSPLSSSHCSRASSMRRRPRDYPRFPCSVTHGQDDASYCLSMPGTSTVLLAATASWVLRSPHAVLVRRPIRLTANSPTSRNGAVHDDPAPGQREVKPLCGRALRPRARPRSNASRRAWAPSLSYRCRMCVRIVFTAPKPLLRGGRQYLDLPSLTRVPITVSCICPGCMLRWGLGNQVG